MKDVLGRDVDLDGDGVAGGSYYLTFDTLSVTPVLATAISGKVFASERGSGGAEVPLAGVTITVDGAEQEIRTVTDAAVNFTLTPLSGWQFFYDDRRPDLPRRRLAGRQLLSFRRETLGSRRRPRGQLRRQYRGHSPEWKYLPSPVPQWRPSEM